MSKDEFFHCLHLTSISPSTAYRWLNDFDYKFCENKISYYTDKHEDAENVKDRTSFISTYFKHEINSFLWVKISADEAVKLENNKEVELPKCYHLYVNEDGKQMREYHVDVHPYLQRYISNTKMGRLTCRSLRLGNS